MKDVYKGVYIMVTKINEKIALKIYLSKKSNQELGKIYGLNTSTVQKIKTKKIWRKATDQNYKFKLKTGRPHQSTKTKKKGWCDNGCGKSVVGNYHGSIYYYECERCYKKYDKKPK